MKTTGHLQNFGVLGIVVGIAVLQAVAVQAASGGSTSVSARSQCSSLFESMSKPTTTLPVSTSSTIAARASTKVLSRDEVSLLLEEPLRFEGRTFTFAKSLGNFSEPFHVRRTDKLPTWLHEAVKDIHILARSPELREDVFGSSTSNRSLVTKANSRPLQLTSRDRGDESPIVEVGLDVFTLNTGERIYFYHTSNDRANIVTDYEFYLSLIDSMNLGKREILSLDSFHTHPLKLLITRDDRSFFSHQLELIRGEYPTLSFEKWTMSTTIESQPVVHTVNLRHWEKK